MNLDDEEKEVEVGDLELRFWTENNAGAMEVNTYSGEVFANFY